MRVRSAATPRRFSISGVLAIGGLLAVVLVSLIAPPLLGADAAKARPEDIGLGVSADHLLGTDELGRDILARVLVATRWSVGMALLTTLIASVLGVLLGSLPLVLKGWPRSVIVGMINATVAMPGLLVAIFLAMILGKGPVGAVLSLSIASVPAIARLTFAAASTVAGSNYVLAASQLGVPRLGVIRRHILPNVIEPLMVNTTAMVGSILVALSALSYLGFGINPPNYDWGSLLHQGLPDLYLNPAGALGPACAIVLTGTIFTFAGEHVTELFVRDRRRSAKAVDATVTPRPADEMPQPESAVVTVQDLAVDVDTRTGLASAVRGVTFGLARGEIVGVVGESGSGKSLMVAALADLLPTGAEARSTRLSVVGVDRSSLGRKAYRRLMGRTFGIVFQDPMNSMTPTMRVGPQLLEAARTHSEVPANELRSRALEQLRAVRLDEPDRRMSQYPWEFSGGMAQRTTIAMCLMTEPEVMLADEPTTALDVTVQAEVVRLLRELRDERQISIVFVSHDIAVVSAIADRVVVMYGGRVMEELPVEGLTTGGTHPYTRALLSSIPTMSTDKSLPLPVIGGRPPELGFEPAGCPFQPRCVRAVDRCKSELPELRRIGAATVACFNPYEERAVATAEGAGDTC